MKNKKYIFSALVLSFILVIAAGVFLPVRRNAPIRPAPQQPSGSGNQIPNSGSPANIEGKIPIKTSTGKVFVNDFRKNAEVASSGVLYFVEKNEYNIAYNSTGNEFILTLLVNKDIEKTRGAMENDFINSLGISREDACKLNVYLYVSAAVDNKLSGNHGLSFCTGSQSFPN